MSVGDRIVSSLFIGWYDIFLLGARFWGGSLAGHATIRVYVVITDLKNGKQLDVASLGTSSSYGQGIFGTITSKQLDSLSTAIVGMFGGESHVPPAL